MFTYMSLLHVPVLAFPLLLQQEMTIPEIPLQIFEVMTNRHHADWLASLSTRSCLHIQFELRYRNVCSQIAHKKLGLSKILKSLSFINIIHQKITVLFNFLLMSIYVSKNLQMWHYVRKYYSNRVSHFANVQVYKLPNLHTFLTGFLYAAHKQLISKC